MTGTPNTVVAVLKKEWLMIDGGQQCCGSGTVAVPAGRHELERVPNPFGHAAPWLVLKGTKIGQAEGAWRDWRNGMPVTDPTHPNYGQPIDWKDWEIVIEEV